MDELNNQVQSFSFDSITKQKIYDYIYSIKTCPYTNFDNFKYEVSSIFHTISKDLLDILMDFRWNRNTPGFMVLRNLPQDINIPFTPIDGNRSINKETFISEACLVGISQFIGEIFSYQQEKNGDLVHNICPVKTNHQAYSNEGSSNDFELHTEVAFHAHKPHYIALYCIKEDPLQQASTTVVDVQCALSELDSDVVNYLMSDNYIINPPESFISISNKNNQTENPILSIHAGRIDVSLNYNPNKMISLSGKHHDAIIILKDKLYKHIVHINLHAGEMLLIDNRKAVHGRTAFTAKFDGHDRWLQRVYIHENLWKNNHSPLYPMRILGL